MKNLKKLIISLLAAAMLLSAFSCGNSGDNDGGDKTEEANTKETTAEPGNPVEAMALPDIMTKILDGVANLPDLWDIELNSENFPAYAFIDYKNGYEGVCSEAMINAVPHTVVLVRVPDGEDAAAVAKSIRDNANPNKWICVIAEKVVVRQYGNTIALVMSATQTANQIISNFDALNGAETPAEDVYVPETTGENTDETLPEETELPLD